MTVYRDDTFTDVVTDAFQPGETLFVQIIENDFGVAVSVKECHLLSSYPNGDWYDEKHPLFSIDTNLSTFYNFPDDGIAAVDVLQEISLNMSIFRFSFKLSTS